MAHTDLPLSQHADEIRLNIERWNAKPSLRACYEAFYSRIVANFNTAISGLDVEIGAGIGNFKKFYPDVISTDVFPHPWVDQVEDAYSLSFADGSVRNLVLFDVFHHLRHPGRALEEFRRVLAPGGRVLIFEPDMGLLPRLVYGLGHHEPLGLDKTIQWTTDTDGTGESDYYAAQGNAYRIFVKGEHRSDLRGWASISVTRLAEWSYLLTGGFSGPSLCPAPLLPLYRVVDRVLGLLPSVFSSRVFIVMTKAAAS